MLAAPVPVFFVCPADASGNPRSRRSAQAYTGHNCTVPCREAGLVAWLWKIMFLKWVGRLAGTESYATQVSDMTRLKERIVAAKRGQIWPRRWAFWPRRRAHSRSERRLCPLDRRHDSPLHPDRRCPGDLAVALEDADVVVMRPGHRLRVGPGGLVALALRLERRHHFAVAEDVDFFQVAGAVHDDLEGGRLPGFDLV